MKLQKERSDGCIPRDREQMGLFYHDEERPSPAAQILMDAIRGIAEKQGHLASERHSQKHRSNRKTALGGTSRLA
jgi:hypothetical protein